MTYEETYPITVRLAYDPQSDAFKKTWAAWVEAMPDPFWHQHERLLGWVASNVHSFYRQNHDLITSCPYVGSLVPKAKGYSGIYVEECAYKPSIIQINDQQRVS